MAYTIGVRKKDMEITDYDKERATVLNAFYCGVRSAMETRVYSNDPDQVSTTRFDWIEDEIKVAKQKLEAIEAEMRVLLGDPFAEEVK
jgi:hypothetical protein